MRSTRLERDRLEPIRQFILRCYPFSDTDSRRVAELEEAEHKLDAQFPQILKDWFQLCGGPGLDVPRLFEGVQDYVIVAHEAQWVVTWGIRIADLHFSDPPVFLDETFARANRGQEKHRWIEENHKFSEFIVQMGLYTTMIDSAFCGGGSADTKIIEQVERHFPLLDLPGWHWPKYPTRFYGANDTYLAVTANDWVWLSAASEESLERVIDQIGIDLDIP